jgi:hypothetical protein
MPHIPYRVAVHTDPAKGVRRAPIDSQTIGLPCRMGECEWYIDRRVSEVMASVSPLALPTLLLFTLAMT